MKNLVMICGKSASGKDTLFKEILNNFRDDLNLSNIISYTTRPKRDNEIENKDYYFITKEKMAEKIFKDEMYEVTEFNEWFYGTGKDSIKEDKINIGVFNPEGVLNLSEDEELNILCFYIKADDKLRLVRSLTREQKPDVDEIIRRFSTDKIDFENFEYNIINLKTKIVVIENSSLEAFSKNVITIKKEIEKFFDI